MKKTGCGPQLCVSPDDLTEPLAFTTADVCPQASCRCVHIKLYLHAHAGLQAVPHLPYQLLPYYSMEGSLIKGAKRTLRGG